MRLCENPVVLNLNCKYKYEIMRYFILKNDVYFLSTEEPRNSSNEHSYHADCSPHMPFSSKEKQFPREMADSGLRQEMYMMNLKSLSNL